MLIIPDSRAWVEVDLEAVRHNYTMVARRAGPGTVVIPMVKADGYGLGAERVAKALDPLKPWGFGVATADEGAALRAAGLMRPILVCNPLPAQAVALAAEHRLTATVADPGGLDRWEAMAEKLGRTLDFHVKVDTGLGRSGFDCRTADCWSDLCAQATRRGLVRWKGVFTHFHSADAEEPAETFAQWRRFQDALSRIPYQKGELLIHASNSAAAMRWPELAGDAVRPGIYLYGGHPSPALPASILVPPRPVASVRARLLLVREASPGSTVGYGATYVASDRELWGTLGIGFGDGLPRVLGNVGHALVRGKRVPLVGRVSMDLTVVNLSTVPEAEVGDVATLIGADGTECIMVDDVAHQAGTICNEILVGLGPRLPRIELARGAT